MFSKFVIETKTVSHDFFFKFDVLLLVDVFEKLRNRSLENFDLCPSHYLSAPAFS